MKKRVQVAQKKKRETVQSIYPNVGIIPVKVGKSSVAHLKQQIADLRNHIKAIS